MKQEHQEYLEYLTKAVVNLRAKPFLHTAMTSHLRKKFNLDHITASDIVMDYFEGLGV